MDIELGQSNPTPGWSWFTKMLNFTDDDTHNAKYNSETICPYIGVVVLSIIIHNIKTIPKVSMHLCKFWAKVTPFYSTIYKYPVHFYTAYYGCMHSAGYELIVSSPDYSAYFERVVWGQG